MGALRSASSRCRCDLTGTQQTIPDQVTPLCRGGALEGRRSWAVQVTCQHLYRSKPVSRCGVDALKACQAAV